MTQLIFTDFMPSKQSAAGKMMPPKAKAADGKTYALVKAVTDLVQYSLGTPLECVVKTEQNGKYTNYTVIAASHVVAAVGPESPAPTQTPSPTPSQPALQPADSPPSRWMPDPTPRNRDDEINRQSARRDAVSLVTAGIFPADQLWDLIDRLAAYTYKSASEVNRDGGGGGAVPQTNAQQLLEAARKIQADIRATYADEDAVCPNCGRAEFLKQWSGGWFCARSKEAGQPGGCGFPEKGTRLDSPVTYGEWRQRTESTLRRPDAPVVSPTSHPTR